LIGVQRTVTLWPIEVEFNLVLFIFDTQPRLDSMLRLLRLPSRPTVSDLFVRRDFHASGIRRTLVPIVIEQTGRGERSYDIFSR